MKKRLLTSAVIALAGVGLITESGLADLIKFDVAAAPASFVDVNPVVALGDAVLTSSLVDGLGDNRFQLSAGQSRTIDFFNLDVSGWLGIGTATVEATLAFDKPFGAEATGSGSSKFGTFFGLIDGYKLIWDSSTLPDTFVAGGDLISVTFNNNWDLAYNGDLATITATITNGGTAPVPEPATLLLFGTGLVGLAGVVRRKRGSS